MVEGRIANQRPRLAVGAVDRSHLHIRRREVGVDAVGGGPSPERVARHEVVAQTCAQSIAEGARTVVRQRIRVVVVGRGVGATLAPRAVATANAALVEGRARPVFFSCRQVKVASCAVGASKHFQFVAHAVCIGVVQTAIAIVKFSWENAIAVPLVQRVVVAGQFVVAPCSGHREHQRHARRVERHLVCITELNIHQGFCGA